MMSSFVTQLAEETPQVLLISSENNLKTLIGSFYFRQGLEVVFLNFQKAAEASSNNILKKDFYKTIVLETSKETNFLDLSKLKNPLIIKIISSINSRPSPLSSLGDNFIIGLDVITKEDSWPVVEYMAKKINQGIILNPKIESYPQSEEAFFKTIKKLLISPQKKQVLVRGKKHFLAVIANEVSRLFELFYSKKLEIKTSFVKPLTIDFSKFEVIEQKAEALPGLLENQVKKIRTVDSRESPPLSFHERNLEKPKRNLRKKETPQHKSRAGTKNILATGTSSQISSLNTSKKPQISNKKSQDFEELINSEKNIDKKLNQIFKTKRVEKKSENLIKTVKTTKKIIKKTKKKKILFFLGLVFTSLAVLAVVLSGVFLLSEFSLKKEFTSSIKLFSSQNGSGGQKNELNLAKLEKKADFLNQQIKLYDNFLAPAILMKSKELAEVSTEVVKQSSNLSSFESSLKVLITSFLGKELLQDNQIVQKINQASQLNYKVISKLISRLRSIKNSENDLKKQEEIKEFALFLESQQKSLFNFQQFYPVIDSLIGLDGKRVYAVVFQNNQELRPTGGFIQAVALVVVDQGMIVDVQTFSSYELDKRLSGAVVPPDEVISLLGENKWYLRDSNWNPDFKVTGKQIAWFLQQETSKKIDGVIGINLFTIANLLKELGPLELSEFNEVITDKNIYERSEFHSEIKLLESSEAKDYQTKLLQALLQDVINRGQEKPLNLLRALNKSLQEKQMLVYLRDKNQETVLSLLGWSGKTIIPQCPAQLSTVPCQVDSLMVVETNIGINKANYHTTRRDQHLVELQKNQAKHTRTIVFNNTAFVNAWPKGNYKTYLRFYLPASAQLISLKADGEDVAQKDFSLKRKSNRTVVGFVLEVPIKTQKNIEISYTVPLEFSLPYSYVFFNQKQSGTKEILPEIVFRHDSELSPTLIAPQAEIQGTAIIFNSLGEDHAFVGASFE